MCYYLCNLSYTFQFDSGLQVQIDIYIFSVPVFKRSAKCENEHDISQLQRDPLGNAENDFKLIYKLPKLHFNTQSCPNADLT